MCCLLMTQWRESQGEEDGPANQEGEGGCRCQCMVLLLKKYIVYVARPSCMNVKDKS